VVQVTCKERPTLGVEVKPLEAEIQSGTLYNNNNNNNNNIMR
jgi:hypothetical protein